jgi:hypothetical protein
MGGACSLARSSARYLNALAFDCATIRSAMRSNPNPSGSTVTTFMEVYTRIGKKVYCRA